MGGAALKIAKTKRATRAEFDTLSGELIDVLKITFKNVAIPLFYNNKESFGDIDIIISTDGVNKNIKEYITETFNPLEIFHNGNCWSFGYKDVQVDLITTSDEHFDSLLDYMGHNDKGNLIGRLAHHKGLKFGDMGLWYEHYFKDINLGKIILCKDPRRIYEFLDLDYNRNLKGFDDLNDIFEFISNSKYFDWRLYRLKNLNKVNRERNLKRKSYMSFLDWIDKNKRDDKDLNEELFKDFDLNKVAEAFPEANLITEIRRLEYEECKSLYIKAKFNGGDVMRKYGFQGKELGDIMSGFQVHVNKHYNVFYKEFILNRPKDGIYETFDFYLQLLEAAKNQPI